jgi:hypothetical protein
MMISLSRNRISQAAAVISQLTIPAPHTSNQEPALRFRTPVYEIERVSADGLDSPGRVLKYNRVLNWTSQRVAN